MFIFKLFILNIFPSSVVFVVAYSDLHKLNSSKNVFAYTAMTR